MKQHHLRLLTASDLGRGAEQAVGLDPIAGERLVIISQRIWQQHFGGREDVLGQTLRIEYEPYTVVGVMPGWFKMQSPFSLASLWTPLDESGVERGINAIARLKPDTNATQVNAELKALDEQRLAGGGEAAASGTNEWIGQARRPQDFLDGDFQTTVWALQGAVAVVLLIATANVVNLLLARGSVRQQEMAVRAAIGGSRFRLVRQLMTESMLLTVLGGALGLGFAAIGVSVIERLRPEEMDSLDTLRFDPTVALVTLGITLLAGLAAGLLPALQGARGDLQAQMAALSGRTSETSAQSRARGVLVVAEIALSTILVVGAGLLVNSFVHLQQIDPGFDADRLLTMRIGVPDGYAEDSGSYWEEVQQSVRAAVGPRAESVSLSVGVPPSGGVEFGTPQPERGELASSLEGVTSTSFVQSNYFDTMGIDLLAGTTLPESPADDETPMVVNEEFARQVWGHTDIVGERVAKLG